MSFMVLNTGRVASQYFYINLNLQPNVIIPSRYAFDYVAKSFIKRRYYKPLTKLIEIKKYELSRQPGSSFGIVFHSARRNLIYPLNSKKNIEFLKALRDDLELNTIFFPFRAPDKVFKSEMNRQLARTVGDWSFPIGLNGWKRKWNLSQFKALKEKRLANDNLAGFLPREINHKNLKKNSKKFIIDTAKIFSLYDLFDNIFENVKVFDFEYLFNDPRKLFRSMSKEEGFAFSDFSLINTKLNSLANRFMLYNGFILEVDSQTQGHWTNIGISKKSKFGFKQKTSLKRILINKQNPFVRSCRIKFEIPKVMSVCEDWGKYDQVGSIPQSIMPFTHNAIKANIGIGMHSEDKPFFNSDEIKEIVKSIHLVICPIFDMNFKILFDYYKNHVYSKEIPNGEFYENFKKNNKKEFLDFNVISKSPKTKLKIS